MTDESKPDRVSQAFDQYVARFRDGRGDAKPFLNQFDGDERRELEALIEAFISTGPVSEPDRSDPRVAALLDRVTAGLEGRSGGLSEKLAALRMKAQMTQEGVIKALAQALEASPAQEEKIDDYYHRLEWGSLPASGLSDQLFQLLGKILRVDPAELRDSVSELGPSQGARSGPVFARADLDRLADDASIAYREKQVEERTGQPRDVIDDLFTGG